MPKKPAPKPRPGLPPSTTIWTEGVDPMVLCARKEQVRQQLSDYKLSQLCEGIPTPAGLGQIWRGRSVRLPDLRRIEAGLQVGNPKFQLKST